MTAVRLQAKWSEGPTNWKQIGKLDYYCTSCQLVQNFIVCAIETFKTFLLNCAIKTFETLLFVQSRHLKLYCLCNRDIQNFIVCATETFKTLLFVQPRHSKLYCLCNWDTWNLIVCAIKTFKTLLFMCPFWGSILGIVKIVDFILKNNKTQQPCWCAMNKTYSITTHHATLHHITSHCVLLYCKLYFIALHCTVLYYIHVVWCGITGMVLYGIVSIYLVLSCCIVNKTNDQYWAMYYMQYTLTCILLVHANKENFLQHHTMSQYSV